MGSSLYPRRKRRHKKMLGGKPCCASMPLIAVLVGLGMFAVVGVRKWLNASAREAAKARSRDDRRAHPLAVLLEHHDIDDQAASFADPVGRCLSLDGPLAEGLGLFTCIADTRFFLDALGEVLHFPSVLTVDVGGGSSHRLAPPSDRGYAMGVGGGSAFNGRVSETVPETKLQARVKVGEDPLPDSADLVLVEAPRDHLSADAWSKLVHSLMLTLSERGVVLFRGPREKEKKPGGMAGVESTWYGGTALWEAIAAAACDRRNGVAAAVGSLDGGVIVLRHAAAGEIGLATGCGHGSETAATAILAKAPPRPLQFERLLLWATREKDTSTALEAVQAKFGGAELVRRNARRRRDRLACLSTHTSEEATALAEPLLETGGHLRARNRHSGHHHSGGAPSPTDVYLAARACLESHLDEHTQDVRAAFALEMLLRAIGGNGAERKVARLRAKMKEEIGPAGYSLWKTLQARAAVAAAAGLLV